MTTGNCPHGEYILREGCPQCVADREGKEGNTEESIAEAVKSADRHIVKVQYFSETTGELSAREYTYFSAAPLNVGDVVMVPVRDTTGKARVSAVDVPPAEIINFADKVKTIPAKYVMPEEMRGVKISPNAARLVDDIAEKLTEPMVKLQAELKAGDYHGEKPAIALALRPGEDIEVHGYYEQSVKLHEYALSRNIVNHEDMTLANDDLSVISKLKRAMEAKKKEKLEPLKVQVEAIRNTYDYLMAPVLEADKITRDKMLAFDTEQRRIRAQEEEINRKRMEAAEAEMKLKGELSEPVGLVEVAPEVKRVSTEMGTTGMVDHWKYEVTDFALLPDEYKVADTAMLNTIAKKHHDQKQIPGVRFYNEPIIAVRAR